MHFSDGGWFLTLTVQVRQNGQWVEVSNLTIISPVPGGRQRGELGELHPGLRPDPGRRDSDLRRAGRVATFVSLGELDVFEVHRKRCAHRQAG